MQGRSRCAECGGDLLAGANNNRVPGFAAAIQFVRQVIGKQVCAAVRYKARQVRAC